MNLSHLLLSGGNLSPLVSGGTVILLLVAIVMRHSIESGLQSIIAWGKSQTHDKLHLAVYRKLPAQPDTDSVSLTRAQESDEAQQERERHERERIEQERHLGAGLVGLAIFGACSAFLILSDLTIGMLSAPLFGIPLPKGWQPWQPFPLAVSYALYWIIGGIVSMETALSGSEGGTLRTWHPFPQADARLRKRATRVGYAGVVFSAIGLVMIFFMREASLQHRLLGQHLSNTILAVCNLVVIGPLMGALFVVTLWPAGAYAQRAIQALFGLALGLLTLALHLPLGLIKLLCTLVDGLLGLGRGAQSVFHGKEDKRRAPQPGWALAPAGAAIPPYVTVIYAFGATILTFLPELHMAVKRLRAQELVVGWGKCPTNARTGLAQLPERTDPNDLSVGREDLEKVLRAVRVPAEYDAALAKLGIEHIVGRVKPQHSFRGELLGLVDIESIAALPEALQVFAKIMPNWSTHLIVSGAHPGTGSRVFQQGLSALTAMQASGALDAAIWVDPSSPLARAQSTRRQDQLVAHGIAAAISLQETTLAGLLTAVAADAGVGIATATIEVVGGTPLATAKLRKFATNKDFSYGDVDVACVQALTVTQRVMEEEATRTVAANMDLTRTNTVLLLTCPFEPTDTERYKAYTEDTDRAVRDRYPSIGRVVFATGSGYSDRQPTTSSVFIQAVLFFSVPSLALHAGQQRAPEATYEFVPLLPAPPAEEELSLHGHQIGHQTQVRRRLPLDE
jgi:uncharacterized membrane protein YhaH (DUF805 family)